MRQIIQTLTLSAAFTVAGAFAYQAAVDYAKEAKVREDPLNLPQQGNPGIPDDVRASIRSSFGNKKH